MKKENKTMIKKTTAMVAASLMIMSLVLGGCGSTGAATSTETTAVEAEAQSDAEQTEAAQAETETGAAQAETEAQTDASKDAAEAQKDAAQTDTAAASSSTAKIPSKEEIEISETYENSTDEEHAITADGEEASYSNVAVVKTGEASGDEADFYGANAAVFATNGATLTLSEITVDTDGTHANGVFSYGEGTTVNISDSVIETSGNCSGGLMTTGGGTMNASNLLIHTTGNSSAAIRSDRGGGTVNVTGGSYTTEGTGSPVIYSTADITVSDAQMESTASQGVVVEGQNSVTLNNVTLTASNVKKNGDKSDWYQAVMIYQSMSGDADEGLASFAMNGGTLTNLNGDVFFVNNTTATIDLTGAAIVNEDEEGVFLRAAAAGWGSEGSNGGHVTMTASQQTIDGDMIVDEVSSLNLYLKESSSFSGAINSDGQAADVYVEIEDGSTWTLTGDSYITSLTCSAGSINLNGHKLYVNGEEYTEGTASEGEAIAMETSSGSSHGDGGQGGSGHGDGSTPPEKPSGDGSGHGDGSTPPEKPSGDGSGHGDGSTPPEKPSGDGSEPPAKPE
ncbi:MAG: hypothetical protein IJ198_00435 [Lachnospiraceae bacterium]|nr:hypothetical protein [Lachnospiraceae bacterium]